MKPPAFSETLSTFQTDKIIEQLNTQIANIYQKGELPSDEFFMQAAIQLSIQGQQKREGGPFGAVIVDEVNGKLQVVGVGANHVLPAGRTPDPTAHAEVSAIRDAQARTDSLEHAKLFTSCECCPMCLAATYEVGMKGGIVFANTREDAANIAGFADDAQYRLAAQPLEAHATQDFAVQLGDHAAVILDKEGNVVATAEKPYEAIQQVAAEKGIDLSSYTLVLKNAPSLFTAIAADWAKIGRVWDAQNPEKSFDTKDASKILYREVAFENKPYASEDMYAEINKPISERAIPTEKIQGGILEKTLEAFHQWRDMAAGRRY